MLDLQRADLVILVGHFPEIAKRQSVADKMDNGQKSLVLQIDEKEAMENPDNILARRLKNRERQRRYRARKRQEADLRKISAIVQHPIHPQHYQHMPTELLTTVPVQVDNLVNLTSPDRLSTRVHCRRDWKKDARRAHIDNKQDIRSTDLNRNPYDATPGACVAPTVDNNSTTGVQFSRRHWKAEARENFSQ